MAMIEQVKSTSSSGLISAKGILFEMQAEQHHHDEKYHREVARLPLHQRLNHMALHFSKYAGKVAAASDTDALVAIYTDTLIIAVSSANILNVELWNLIARKEGGFSDLLAFGRAHAVALGDTVSNRHSLLRETAIAAGRVAAACEKIDHLEPISYRSEIGAGIGRLAELATAFIARQGIDPTHAVRKRLADVKQRLVLHGRI